MDAQRSAEAQHFPLRDWELAFAGDLLREILQLLRVWQIAVEQQISNLPRKWPSRHLMNVVARYINPAAGNRPSRSPFHRRLPRPIRGCIVVCFSNHGVR